MKRNDPTYVSELVKKKPKAEDPKDILIREKIEKEVLGESWAREAFAKARDIQIAYLKELLQNLDNRGLIHRRTQEVLREISKLFKAEIVEGKENLSKIPKGSPVLVMTNHLGTYKLAGINPQEDLGINIPGYDFMYPYPLYFASMSPVAKALKNNLYYVSDDFPLQFGEIHSAAGFIHVPPAIQKGRTKYLEEQTREAIKSRPNSAIVNFPEGGTSGKYNGLGPYNLEQFHTGGYVIAQKLGIHCLPVAQYFDKDKGFQLKVFEPFIPKASSKDDLSRYAEENQKIMQEWLDEKTSNSA